MVFSGSVSSLAMGDTRRDGNGARWWQRGIIYQVYPRSFLDRNGDGIGDLAGIIAKLDYVQWLGVDAIWISPIYPSPMADFGYDVSDYMNMHPMFGSLRDFDELVASAHRLGIRVILDLVPNHTSEEHPWFVESRSSRTNPKRDWYIWQGLRLRMGARRTTGSAPSEAPRGNGIRKPSNTITMPT